jgi:hypothetical protein
MDVYDEYCRQITIKLVVGLSSIYTVGDNQQLVIHAVFESIVLSNTEVVETETHNEQGKGKRIQVTHSNL